MSGPADRAVDARRVVGRGTSGGTRLARGTHAAVAAHRVGAIVACDRLGLPSGAHAAIGANRVVGPVAGSDRVLSIQTPRTA